MDEELAYEEDTQKDRFLTFTIGNEVYAIEICSVIEIISIQEITEVPEVPAYIKGIINLRGRIIPVMDVRLRLKKQFRPYNERTCIIVIETRGIFMGLIIDAVSEVTFIPENQIAEKPEIQSAQNQYIKSIGKVDEKVKLILDCDQLINDADEARLIHL